MPASESRSAATGSPVTARGVCPATRTCLFPVVTGTPCCTCWTPPEFSAPPARAPPAGDPEKDALRRVDAAMSGGVDSAVAAARMVEAGHEVVGVHLALSQNAATLRESARGCCTIEDAGDARRVADMIGIPF